MLASTIPRRDLPLGPASSLSKRISKPWGHDCREHRSWRCVWCESQLCFECDTGTTAFIDRFPYHRLCEQHASELPGPATDSDNTSQISINSSFSFICPSSKQASLSKVNFEAEPVSSDSYMCHCLVPKTMICSGCVDIAKATQAEQAKIFESTGTIECAYNRFPGKCKAAIGAKCTCGGRGINCTFVSDTDWKKFEETDLLWLGRTGLPDDDFKKKEKKDLRRFFGDSFPILTTHVAELKNPFTTPRQSTPSLEPPKKAGIWGKHLRRSRSVNNLSSNRKRMSVETRDESRPRTPMNFLMNPQMRKPYNNFRATNEGVRAPTPMRRRPDESYLDIDSEDDNEDSFDDEEQENDEGSSGSDYASIADSISTLGSEYDYDDSVETKGQYITWQKVVSGTPTLIKVGTAALATKAVDGAQLVGMGKIEEASGSPDTSCSTKLKEKEKWGCCNKVDFKQIDLNSTKAHGFWRCSFCNGKIHGV